MPQYFTEYHHDQIRLFLKAETDEEKHRIFNEGILPAFEKLIENLIFVYTFFSLDDVETLKRDCLSNLYEMLPKFNPDRGSKAFSYFNVVAKNWFIQKAKEKARSGLAYNEQVFDRADDDEDDTIDADFLRSLYEEMDHWRTALTKKTERNLLDAILFLLRHPDVMPLYNKKAVLLYLREMTGMTDKQVAVNMKRMKQLYSEWRARTNE